MKALFLLVAMALSNLCYADITVYKTTDNTGINKKEQIEGIEKYLADLGLKLNSMELKIDQNALKLKSLEATVAKIQDVDIKKLKEDVVPKLVDEKTAEEKARTEGMEKLKADILAIKNTDIEQLKLDINGLRFSVKNVEKILKVPGK